MVNEDNVYFKCKIPKGSWVTDDGVDIVSNQLIILNPVYAKIR